HFLLGRVRHALLDTPFGAQHCRLYVRFSVKTKMPGRDKLGHDFLIFSQLVPLRPATDVLRQCESTFPHFERGDSRGEAARTKICGGHRDKKGWLRKTERILSFRKL